MAHARQQPTLVSLQHVGFRFDQGPMLFDQLDLCFDHAPTAIVGRNGIGKSVLAQLIAGRLDCSTGTIDRYGSLVYVDQDANAACVQTVAQLAGVAEVLHALKRVAEGRAEAGDFVRIGDRWDLAARLREALDDAGLRGIAFEHPVPSLSCGQRMRVALAGALLSSTDLLVLDEPSNHLDRHGRDWLHAALGRWRGGLIVVSHDRQLLSTMQRVIELTPHGARSYGGNYEFFHAQRETERQAAQLALDAARHERASATTRLQHEHDTIRRHAAATRRNAAKANVSGSERFAMKSALREAMGEVRQSQRARKSELDARVRETAARVLPASAVLVTMPGAHLPERKPVFSVEQARLPHLAPDDPAATLSWCLTGPARVTLRGPNGSGKSTLLRMLAGELAPLTGRCAVHVPFAYLDQRLDQLDPTRSIIEQLGLLDTPLAEGELRSRLALLQLDARRASAPTCRLSGGERLKAALALALWAGSPAQLLLLDEPTNHLDLESIQAFEEALGQFPGAIVAASHDDAFLAALQPTHTMQRRPRGWLFEPMLG